MPLGANQTINGSFQLSFIDNTIKMVGVVGYSYDNRDNAEHIFISGIVLNDNHTARIYGKTDTSVTIPSTAHVYVLYELN